MKAYRKHETVEVAAHRHEYVSPANRVDALTHFECRVCQQYASINLVKGVAPESIVKEQGK